MKKKVTAEDLVASAWAAALATDVIPNEVPPGWHTTAQLAKKLNKSVGTMGRLLLAAVRAGKCDTQKFRVQVGSLVRPAIHYKLK